MNLIQRFRLPADHPHHLGKFAILLAVLLAIITAYPFFSENLWVQILVITVGFLTILSALWAVNNSMTVLISCIALAIPTFALNVVNSLRPDDVFAFYAVPLAFAFYLIINLSLLNSVVKTRVMTLDILCGAVAVYLLIGINWALVYTYIDLLNPEAFKSSMQMLEPDKAFTHDFVYFSFVTLATLGYGDIVPVSTTARTFAMLEAIVGALYIAVIIGKIVSTARPTSTESPAPKDKP